MSEYGENYEHYRGVIERRNRPSRRLYDTYRHILPVLGIVRPHEKVLDLGCGIGEVGHDLRLLGVETTSIDISTSAHSLGRKVFGQENRHFRVVGNVQKLPFMDESFKTVVSYDLFEHLYPAEMEEVLSEVERVISGSKIFIKLTPVEDKQNIDA